MLEVTRYPERRVDTPRTLRYTLAPLPSPGLREGDKMLFVYSLLATLSVLAAFPVFLLASLREPEIRRGIRERLGWVPMSPSGSPSPVWVQAVSVGEVQVARQLLAELEPRLPGWPVLLSSTTPGGRRLAGRSLSERRRACTFPLDLPAIVGLSLRRIGPRALILMETEIWPNLLLECARRGIPVFLANGRISDRSLPRYAFFRPLLRRVLREMTLLCMQTEVDAERIRYLGADPDRVRVTGSLKWDLPVPGTAPEALRESLRVPAGAPVLVAGSTSEGEEEEILAACEEVRRRSTELRLILAPRHPDRFGRVASLLAQRGVSFSRRSEGGGLQTVSTLLLDTLGELGQIYAVGTACFVGGSLVSRGGQNLIEPAAAGRPVLFGPRTENFADAARRLVEAGAGFRVTGAPTLAAELHRLLTNPTACEEAGRRGLELVARNRGAARRTAEMIALRMQAPEG